MRISDWSSDVCSSDLQRRGGVIFVAAGGVQDVVEQRHLIGAGRGIGQLDREQRAARAGAGQYVCARVPAELDRFLADIDEQAVHRGESNRTRAIAAEIQVQEDGKRTRLTSSN